MQPTITKDGNLPKLHPRCYIRIDMVHISQCSQREMNISRGFSVSIIS